MGKYLKFYTKYAKSGKIPHKKWITNKLYDYRSGGLCGIFGTEVMDIFTPAGDDCIKYNVRTWSYYGADVTVIDQATQFSTTRQNMVLLLAVMNREL